MQIEIPASDAGSALSMLRDAHAARTIAAVADNSFEGWRRAIAALLAARGDQQKDVAQKTGFAASKVSRLLSGEQSMSVEDLGAILGAYGVTPHRWADWLDMVNNRPRSVVSIPKESQGRDADDLQVALDVVSGKRKKD